MSTLYPLTRKGIEYDIVRKRYGLVKDIPIRATYFSERNAPDPPTL